MHDPRLDPYYRLLGLDPGADTTQVKKAYRKLAMKYHPDRNSDPGAKAHFIRLTEAYEIIMNPPRTYERAQYSGQSETQRQREWERTRKQAKEEARQAARQRYREFLKKKEFEQAREYRKGIYIFISIVLVVGGGYFSNQWYDSLMIDKYKGITKGRVTLVDNHSVYVVYEWKGDVYEHRSWVSKGEVELYSDAGLPVFKGDEYQIELDTTRPQRARINFHRVSISTLKRTLSVVEPRAFRALLPLLGDIPESSRPQAVSCILDESLKEFGLEAWGDMYFSHEHFLDNLHYNSMTWDQRLNHPRFKALLVRCGVSSDGNP